MLGICINMVLFGLITLSLKAGNDLVGFIISILSVSLAFVLSHKGIILIYKSKVNIQEQTIKFDILISIIVWITYGKTMKLTEYDNSNLLYILLETLVVLSLIEVYLSIDIKRNESETKKVTEREHNKMSIKELSIELENNILKIEKQNSLIYSKYKKISSLRRIEKLGLNMHEYKICCNIEDTKNICRQCRYFCTIRSDISVNLAKKDNSYPFYIIRNKDDLNTNKINAELFQNNYIAIITNALKYDKYLKYNMALYFEPNGNFMVEYNFENIPWRKMYDNGSRNLHYIDGNIFDEIHEWNRTFIGDNNKLDLRILKDILNTNYMICENNDLYGKYIELSCYTKPCGRLNSEIVYWEI